MKNKLGAVVISIVMLALILCIGPLDMFAHGFYADKVPYGDIGETEIEYYTQLDQQSFTQLFTPSKGHFAGFELNLVNIPKGSAAGRLVLSVFDDKENLVVSKDVDLNELTDKQWTEVHMASSLQMGQLYALTIKAEACEQVPYLQIVPDYYLFQENQSGNLLIGYAYAQSTFTFAEKAVIILLLVGVWTVLLSKCLGLKMSKSLGIFVIMVSVLTWNYSQNIMDIQNTTYSGFQMDSETLVWGAVMAERDGHYVAPYGLGRYVDERGVWRSHSLQYTNDNVNWKNGYSLLGVPQLSVHANEYTRSVCRTGNYIRFANGEELAIANVEPLNDQYIVTLAADYALSYYKYGDLSEARFLDENKQELPRSRYEPYISQFGLQGKVFRHMARYLDSDLALVQLNLLCCLAAAIVFTAIVYLIKYKYDLLMAGCFYATFWLSPFVVNFARNLYWLEFLWYMPMLISLVCLIKIDQRKYRLLCYGAIFVTILIKSLCGYEYVSAIMLAMVTFPLADFGVNVARRNWKAANKSFWMIFFLGLFAVLGFVAALLIHARLRGDGNLMNGIQTIIERDVKRRLGGGEWSDYGEVYKDSLNASIWFTVLSRYIRVGGQVLTGIPGNLLPLLIVAPACVLWYHGSQKANYEHMTRDVILYIGFLITALSWIVIAKPHSYIHAHLNFVLWYTGFVQICLYIIIKGVTTMGRGLQGGVKRGG